MKEIILRYRKELVFGTIVFWAALLGFGFGYLVAQRGQHAPIIIERCSDLGPQAR